MNAQEEESLRHLLCAECFRTVRQQLFRIVPSWHKHSIDVRFRNGEEILYCVDCGEEEL